MRISVDHFRGRHPSQITSTLLLLAGLSALIGCTNAKPDSSALQNELVKKTQELFDAVTSGDQKPWKSYIASDAMYFDEKGRNMDKTALVNDVTPLPEGMSGAIKLVHPQSRIVGNTAILSYDLDESETVFGQDMTARYHETDTWMRRNGEWQIIAGQAFRYYEDPAPGVTQPAKYRDYVGTL